MLGTVLCISYALFHSVLVTFLQGRHCYYSCITDGCRNCNREGWDRRSQMTQLGSGAGGAVPGFRPDTPHLPTLHLTPESQRSALPQQQREGK